MDKISGAQAQQLLKVAAASVRSLSQANQKLTTECGDLKTKVASYERKEHAEKIASLMEEKGVNAELSFQDKVASLLEGDRDLDVVEEALNLGTPHIKVAVGRRGFEWRTAPCPPMMTSMGMLRRATSSPASPPTRSSTPTEHQHW
jgi:hypothetical protein